MTVNTESHEREIITRNVKRIADLIALEGSFDDCDDHELQRLNAQLADECENLRLWLLGLEA